MLLPNRFDIWVMAMPQTIGAYSTRGNCLKTHRLLLLNIWKMVMQKITGAYSTGEIYWEMPLSCPSNFWEMDTQKTIGVCTIEVHSSKMPPPHLLSMSKMDMPRI